MYVGLRLEDFHIVKEIGKGGFGVVYEATHPQLKRVALKKILSGAGGVHASKIKSEYELLHKIDHNNVVKLYGYFKSNHDHYLVMELCEHGSIRSFVRKNGPLPDPSAAYVMKQLVCAVRQCHKMKVIHRDLSAGNILISRISTKKLLTVKICDFGLARTLSLYGGAAQTVVGTPGFMAPELLGGDYNESADVFSLGAALFTMLTADDPPAGGKPPSFVKLSSLAADLISQMMCEDERRISLRDILTTPFMTAHVESCDERHSRQMNLSSREFSVDRRGASVERRHLYEDRGRCESGDRRGWSRERSVDRMAARRGSRETSREARLPPLGDDNIRRNSADRQYGDRLNLKAKLSEPAAGDELQQRQIGRPRIRSSSQPPTNFGREPNHASRDRESGFESAGDQVHVLRPPANATKSDTAANRSRTRASSSVWPLSTKRLCSRTFVRPKVGRLRVTDNGNLIFEQENERGCVGHILQIAIEDRGQELLFYSPLRSGIPCPRQMDPPVEIDKTSRIGPYRSLSSMGEKERAIYGQARVMLSQLRSQVDKLILRRPVQFPWAQAKIMESGDLRVVPVSEEETHGEKLVRKVTNGKVAFRRYLGNSNGVDITDADTLNRMQAVHAFLLEMESCVEKSGQPFPFVMTAGSSSTPSPTASSRVQSAIGSRSRLFTNQVSLPMPSMASAPATIDRRPPLTELRQGVRAAGERHDEYAIKDIGRSCFSVKHTGDGRFLRMSTAVPNLLIYRPNEFDPAKEERFSVKEVIPREARDLVDKLKVVLRERRLNSARRV